MPVLVRKRAVELPEQTKRFRILFSPLVDASNVNAQSLNVREIALRFDPKHFQITLWYGREPDSRLIGRPGIRLEKLPPCGRTARIMREMLAGYDIISYMDYSPASYAFVHLPRFLRRSSKAVLHAEAPTSQLVSPSRTLRFLYDGIVPHCDVYVGITEFIARDIQAVTGKKANYVLPVGVDTALFTPPTVRANSPLVVLFAGTLIERKGPQFVLDAAALFPNTIFRLVGAGRGGFDEVLKQRIVQSNLKNVIMDGPKSQLELRDIMRESDIFLLPSRLEGIPKVTLEAAATGLPCVVFKDYETPSVVHGVTGFQVGTVDEMTQALGRLIGDGSLRDQMGANAREHVQQFDWDPVTRQWENAYLEIASGQAR